MKTEDVERFLEAAQKDRQWLADEIGCSKGTLNNWMSAGEFPLWAEKSIARMLDQFDKQVSFDEHPQFSLGEWQIIQNAATLSGATSAAEFAKFAIIQKAAEILDREKKG